MTFDDIYGHEAIIDRLARTAARRTPHHAYIFHGTSGVGRKRVALGFAAALNCEGSEGSRPPGRPCGDCPSCRRIRDGVDTDVLIVVPTAKTKSQEGSDEGVRGPRRIRVDDVREVQGRLAYRARPDRFRMIVFALKIQLRNDLLLLFSSQTPFFNLFKIF